MTTIVSDLLKNELTLMVKKWLRISRETFAASNRIFEFSVKKNVNAVVL
jgi:hypothetical protein